MEPRTSHTVVAVPKLWLYAVPLIPNRYLLHRHPLRLARLPLPYRVSGWYTPMHATELTSPLRQMV